MRILLGLLLIGGLTFTCQSQTKSEGNEEPGTSLAAKYVEPQLPDGLAQATFAGGCFWCVEAAFERIQGVEEAVSGYTGGKEQNPTYEQVSYGRTGHAEAVRVYYRPELVDYQTLLEVFFVAHDPTQLNRQGPDVGKQYRSAIFYHNDEQEQLARAYIDKLGREDRYQDRPIVTKLQQVGQFWVAEDYHQDYYEAHPDQPYVAKVSRPKVEKVEKVFSDILKPQYRKKSGTSEK